MSKQNKKRWLDTAVSLLFATALFFFILTSSIGLPIYFRPFYYAHIDALELEAKSGFVKEQIIKAYDEVLDYLTLPNKEFSTGDMKFSAEGKAHFNDCKALFDLNALVLIFSGLCLILLLILRKTEKLKPFCLAKRSASFYSALTAVVIPVAVGALASIDFNKAFVVFHDIFFKGKANWLFNPRTDEIIRVLPEKFFMNCAILIGAGILTWSVAIMLIEFIRYKKGKTDS